MASWSTSIENSKKYFVLTLILFVAGIIFCVFLYLSAKYNEWKLVSLREDASQLQQQNANFFLDPKFEKFSLVKNLEANNPQMPWSEHIEKVSEIIDGVKELSAWSDNIKLEEFQISLENLSLKGSVSNLRILYHMPYGRLSLIERFESLDFLKDIAIQTYDKKTWDLGFSFVLTAKVENNYD